MRRQSVVLSVALLIVILAYQNCGRVSISPLKNGSESASGGPGEPGPVPEPEITNPVPEGAKVVEVKNGFSFTEGPSWSADGALYFTDIVGNRLHRYTPGSDKLETVLEETDSLNGTAFDLQGRLIAVRGKGEKNVVRIAADGTETEIASRYFGSRFNGPNDLAIFADGSIFFTDPDFSNNPTVRGVYRVLPNGEVVLVDNMLEMPNGIVFSPDFKRLYVSDTNDDKVWVWDVDATGAASNKRLFFQAPDDRGGSSGNDGMEIDSKGNLYVTCRDRVWIVNEAGELVTSITVPAGANQLTNVGFGGEGLKTLFITAGPYLHKIELLIGGVKR